MSASEYFISHYITFAFELENYGIIDDVYKPLCCPWSPIINQMKTMLSKWFLFYLICICECKRALCMVSYERASVRHRERLWPHEHEHRYIGFNAHSAHCNAPLVLVCISDQRNSQQFRCCFLQLLSIE